MSTTYFFFFLGGGAPFLNLDLPTVLRNLRRYRKTSRQFIVHHVRYVDSLDSSQVAHSAGGYPAFFNIPSGFPHTG